MNGSNGATRLKLRVFAAALILAVIGVGCNQSKFSGNNKKVAPPRPQNHVIKVMGMEEDIQGGRKIVADIDRVDFVIQAADTRVLDEDVTYQKQPVDLYFVLDTTASMRSVITSIKNGITRLVDSLAQSGVNLQVGMVGFVDSYAAADQRTFQLSSDLAGFQNFLSGIAVTNNDDFPESSLYAIRKAVELLGMGGGRREAVKAILLISDVIGHNGSQMDGGEPMRDCNVGPAVNDINNFARNLGDSRKVKFFYLVPDPLLDQGAGNGGAVVDCNQQPNPNGMNALRQMRDLMAAILPDVPQPQRGGPLLDRSGQMAWPLTENNMLDTLGPMIEESAISEDIRGSCLARKADLFEGSRNLYTWEASDLREIEEAFNRDNEVMLSNVLEQRSGGGVQRLRLEVERCCLSAEDISAGRYGNCYKSYVQNIHYEIENRSSQ